MLKKRLLALLLTATLLPAVLVQAGRSHGSDVSSSGYAAEFRNNQQPVSEDILEKAGLYADAPTFVPAIEASTAPEEANGINAIAGAIVNRLNGNKNELTITVEGPNRTYTETFLIDNNSAGTYKVGEYEVYVDTKGNTQIIACYIVSYNQPLPMYDSDDSYEISAGADRTAILIQRRGLPSPGGIYGWARASFADYYHSIFKNVDWSDIDRLEDDSSLAGRESVTTTQHSRVVPYRRPEQTDLGQDSFGAMDIVSVLNAASSNSFIFIDDIPWEDSHNVEFVENGSIVTLNDSWISLRLNGEYERFISGASIYSSPFLKYTFACFTVIGDGKVIEDMCANRFNGGWVYIDVDVSGVDVLVLLASMSIDNSGEGDWDDTVDFMASWDGPSLRKATGPTLTVPTNFRATGTTNESITVAWNSVTNASGYDIEYRNLSTNVVGILTAQGSSATIPRLTPGTGYEIRVRSKSATAIGDWSTPISVWTALPAPTGFRVVGSTPTSITVDWASATGAAGYDIEFRDLSTNTAVFRSTVAATYTELGLTPGTRYEVRVRAKNTNVIGNWSDSLFISTDIIISQSFSGAGEYLTIPIVISNVRRLSDAEYVISFSPADFEVHEISPEPLAGLNVTQSDGRITFTSSSSGSWNGILSTVTLKSRSAGNLSVTASVNSR